MAIQKFLFVDSTTGAYFESGGAYETTDFKATSVGAGDAGAPIKLDASGKVDFSLLDGTVANVPHGFPNRTSTTIAFDDATMTFTLAKTSADFYFYNQGKEFVRSSDQTVVITDTEGLWYIYFNSNGDLTASQTPWIFAQVTSVAIVYWNATDNRMEYLGDERHGTIMDTSTHSYLHNTVGTRYESGFAITANTAGDGSLDAHAQISVGVGSIWDEDLKYTTSGAATAFRVLYLNGASANMRRSTGYNSGAFPFLLDTRPQYNQFSGGVWSLSAVPTGKFATYWIFATNSGESGSPQTNLVSVPGQAYYDTQADAENNDVYGTTFDYSKYPVAEFKVLYKLIYEVNDSFTNSVNARLVQVSDYRNASSLAASSSVGTTPSSHGALTGLTNDDHPQYLLVNGTRDIEAAIEYSSEVSLTVDTQLTHKAYVDDQDALRLALAGGTMSGDINMNNNSITNVDTPVNTGDATNKTYVDTADGLRIKKDGTEDFTGIVNYSSHPTFTTDTDIVDKKYVDDQDVLRLALTGGTMSGSINMGTYTITNMGEPTNASDAATKSYVDTLAAGLDPKESVQFTTKTTLTGASYATTPSNGQFTNVDLTSSTLFDQETGSMARAIALNDRILVKNQTDAKQNGIYKVTDATTPTAATLTRSYDQDGTPEAEVSGGNFTYVELGDTYGGSKWIVVGDGVLTLNTDNLVWTQYAGADTYTAGNGLNLSGGEFSVKADITGGANLAEAINVSANGVAIKVDDTTIYDDGSGQLSVKFASGEPFSADANGVHLTIDTNNLEIGGNTLSVRAESLGGLVSTVAHGLSVNVDDATIEINGSYAVAVKNSGITSTQIATTAVDGTSLTGGAGTALSVNFSTTYNDAKAISASDLSSTSTGKGASIIGIFDSGSKYTATTVEGALQEVAGDVEAVYTDFASVANAKGASLVGIEDTAAYYSSTNVEGALAEIGADIASLESAVSGFGTSYTVGSGGVTKGDLVYISANDTVSKLSSLGDSYFCIGIAASTVSASGSVKVLSDDTIISGVFSGTGVAGSKYYWSGSAWTTTMPTADGAYVWQIGVGKNTNDAQVEVNFVKKNSGTFA